MHPSLERLCATLEVGHRFRDFARAGARLSAAYHRASLHGLEHLPPGPALLVGNHGMYGYETPAFFYLLHRETGRYPLGLADRGFHKLFGFRRLLEWVGGLPGTVEHGLRALRGGAWVVCYPGGVREVFKGKSGRYGLRWSRSLGFVRLAGQAGVPVVPFAAQGVDDAFWFDERLALPSPLNPSYRAPACVPLPLPARFSFRLGAPEAPPPPSASEDSLRAFRDRLAAKVRSLLLQGHA